MKTVLMRASVPVRTGNLARSALGTEQRDGVRIMKCIFGRTTDVASRTLVAGVAAREDSYRQWLMARFHRELTLDHCAHQRETIGIVEERLFTRAECSRRKSTPARKKIWKELAQELDALGYGRYPSGCET